MEFTDFHHEMLLFLMHWLSFDYNKVLNLNEGLSEIDNRVFRMYKQTMFYRMLTAKSRASPNKGALFSDTKEMEKGQTTWLAPNL